MSYGNVYIAADLKKGATVKSVGQVIKLYYPYISLARAEQIARTIKEKGADVGIDWSRKKIRRGRGYKNKWGTLVY